MSVTTTQNASASVSASAFLGRSVPRLEDARLLRGAGRFVDDIALPGLLHATFVRSPLAHALIRGVDAAKARALPGVRAVLTYADLRPVLSTDRIPLACRSPPSGFMPIPVRWPGMRSVTSASRSRWW
jgi:aerobic carbon-monoxide dehydrogenase large subunit